MDQEMPIREVYLDYAASTPIDDRVRMHMAPFYSASYGNPSSLHTRGRRSRVAIEEARSVVASHIGAQPDEIIFTGSGTEANNSALIGSARALRKKGNHILVSSIEHASVLAAAEVLRGEGFVVEYIPVTHDGRIDIAACRALVREETVLVSVMLVNNEIGTIQPIQELMAMLKEVRGEDLPLVHVDACQAFTVLPVQVAELGVDLLTMNGSKIYGPHGVGMLYIRRGVTVLPLIQGGGQERGIRAGTESVALIQGFMQALVLADAMRADEYARLTMLKDVLITKSTATIPHIEIHGQAPYVVPSIVHMSVPHVEGEAMLMMLDEARVYVGTGSACAATDVHPSHVLRAMQVPPALMHGSIRVSLGRYTTLADIEYFVQVFLKVVQALRAMSPYAHRDARTYIPE